MNPLAHMEKMEKILHYVLDRLDYGCSLEDTARAFDYHPAYFSRIFREHFGCPYNKFTNKLKMRRAASDLKKNRFIKSICEKYGYSSVESFSKAFQKEFGMPPRQFKKNCFTIPDMPLPESMNGKKFSMEYKVTASRTFIGQGIPFESKEKLDIFQDIAYGLTCLEKYSIFDHCPPEEKPDKWIGVWHGGSDWKLHYYIGGSTLSQASTPPHKF